MGWEQWSAVKVQDYCSLGRSPLRRRGRPPRSRCLCYRSRIWRRWSCILLRSRCSPWRSPPGSEGWGQWADLSAWPAGLRGPRQSWRPSRSRRSPVGGERKAGERRVTSDMCTLLLLTHTVRIYISNYSDNRIKTAFRASFVRICWFAFLDVTLK